MDPRPVAAVVMLAALAGCSDSPAPAPAPPPRGTTGAVFPVADATLSLPPDGARGHPMWDSWYDVGELGYVEQEYFVAGTAQIQPGGAQADYTTRFILWRPADPAKFNGTVVLDWVNVTARFENAVDTLESHAFLLRNGYAFAHVSAQAAGLCCTPLTPQVWDPERYASLSHPGDDWSFDMFAQIAKAIRSPTGLDPMGGLKVQRVLAAGQSQSGQRLHAYVNLGYARSGVIDGFLVHGDVGSGKQFAELPVPVLQLLSDFEAEPEEPTPHANYALWEIAGAAHSDFWIGYHQEAGQGPRVMADAPQQPASADEELHLTAGNYGEQPHPAHGVCTAAGAAFPVRYAVNAALAHLHRWTAGGPGPPSGPRYAFDEGGALARDDFGNALGGIRYPPIDVPVASYQSTACQLGGITVPFSEAQLQVMYPTHADYFCRMKAATAASVRAGYLLQEDADDLMARVEAARNRWAAAGERNCP
jgi:hypothetical protein